MRTYGPQPCSRYANRRCRTPPYLASTTCFQAAQAKLHRVGKQTEGENHGALWRAADGLRTGLGSELKTLYSMRRKADYAHGKVPAEAARKLVEQFRPIITQELGIADTT